MKKREFIGHGLGQKHFRSQCRIPSHFRIVGVMDLSLQAHQQAAVLAFNDCFLVVGVALLIGSGLILMTKRVAVGTASDLAAH